MVAYTKAFTKPLVACAFIGITSTPRLSCYRMRVAITMH